MKVAEREYTMVDSRETGDLKTRVLVDKFQREGNMFPYEIRNHNGPVKMVKFNRSSTIFASCCAQDKKVFIYDAFTFQILNVFFTKFAIVNIEFTSDSKFLVGFGSMDSVYFLRVDDFTKTEGGKFSEGSRHRQAFFDGYIMKSGGLSYGSERMMLVRQELFRGEEDYKVNFLEVYDLKMLRKSMASKSKDIEPYLLYRKKNKPEDAIVRALFDLDPEMLYTATPSEIQKINTTTDEILFRTSLMDIDLSKVTSMTMSQKFELLSISGREGVALVNPTNLQLIRKFTTEFPMNVAVISPRLSFENLQKYHIIMGGGVSARDTAQSKQGGTEILLFNLCTGEKLTQLTGHYGPVNWLSWFRDGGGFISAGEEGVVRVFRLGNAYNKDKNFA